MPYYLTQRRGSGTHDDPYRPIGADETGDWSCIDLSPADALLLWTAIPFSHAQARLIASDAREGLASATRAMFASSLGITPSATVFDEALLELMLAPPTNGWLPVRPTRAGMLEVHLGPLSIARPLIRGGSANLDHFDRPDETPLGAPWGKTTGSTQTINLSSGGIVAAGSANSDKLYYYDHAYSDNTYSQFEIAALAALDCGPAVRVNPGEVTGYFQNGSPAHGVYAVCRLYQGNFLNIDSGTGAWAVGDIMKIDVDGSTLKQYKNGAQVRTNKTDTQIPTGGYVGVFMYDRTTDKLDNWQGGDIGDEPMSGSVQRFIAGLLTGGCQE